jgi:site-specific DNA-cytosine methylase
LNKLNILIACEVSGIVRDSFKFFGHKVTSCDLYHSERRGRHYQGDVRDILHNGWDMIIAFPPCTHLACSGAKHFKVKSEDGRMRAAIEFFMMFTELDCPRVVIENPIGIMSTLYRKPDQIIQPWMFGEPYQKSTCLWLKGVPKLTPTKIVHPGEFVTSAGGKRIPKWFNASDSYERSKTFEGIAKAMAYQWGRR